MPDIEKVYDGLTSKNKFLNTLYGIINRLIKVNDMNDICWRYRDTKRTDFVDKVFEERGIKLIYDQDRLSQLQQTAPFVIVANHPHGIVDGLLLVKLFDRSRQQFKIVVNSYLSPIKSLTDNFLLVDIFDDSTDYAFKFRACKNILENIGQGNTVAFFPAADISRFSLRKFRIEDTPWSSTFSKIISKQKPPILPIYISGRNSSLFYLLVGLYPPLGKATLIREFFLKRDFSVHVKFGELISKDELHQKDLGQYLRNKVYNLR